MITTILLSVLAGVLVLVAVIVCFRYPNAKYFVFTVAAAGLGISGWFSTLHVNNYYKAQGGIIGTLIQVAKPNQMAITETTFDFQNVMLTETEQENLYRARFSTADYFKLSADKFYSLTVNGTPCNYSQNDTDYVKATYNYNFYDKDKNFMLNDTLTFYISFFDNSTVVLIETNGGAEAVKKWNYYFNRNNFKLKIEQVDEVYLSEETDNFKDFCFVSVNLPDGTLHKKTLLKKGTNFKTVLSADKTTAKLGLIKSNNQYVDTLENVTENTVIEGLLIRDKMKISENEYLVTGLNGSVGVHKINAQTAEITQIYANGNWGEITKVAVGIVEPSLDPTTGEMSGETSTIWGYRFKGVGNYNILTWNPQSGDFSLVDGTPGSGSQIPGGEKDPPNSEWGDL